MSITLDSLSSIEVTATDLDIRDLTHASDSVKIGDGTDFLAVNGDGSINVVATATDLDIRDLVNTQDSIAIGDESTLVDMAIMDSAFGVTSAGFPIMGIRRDADTSPVSATGDSHPLVFDSLGRLKTDASVDFGNDADDAASSQDPLSIGGVSASTASALGALSAAGDRGHMLMDLYRRQFTNESHNIAWKVEPHTIGATETEVAATPLGGRKRVIIQNTSSNSVWVGEATGVTTSGATRGIEIPKNASMDFDFGEALNLFVISDGASREINVLEAA
jgi:hypothetical protein